MFFNSHTVPLLAILALLGAIVRSGELFWRV